MVVHWFFKKSKTMDELVRGMIDVGTTRRYQVLDSESETWGR